MKDMHKMLVLVFVSGLFTIVANAALLEYEGFDYSGTNIDTMNGGSGWASAWSDPDNDLNLSDDNSSLNSWSFPYTPAGARILDKNGGEATRVLGAPVNMGEDGVTYFSLLMRKDTTGGWSSEYLGFSLIDYASVKKLYVALGSNEKFTIQVGGSGGAENSNLVVSAGSTYFVVIKLVRSAAGDDEAFLKVYEPYDTIDTSEPAVWDISDTGTSSANLTNFLFQVGDNITAGGMMDELRIGETWSDVVPADPVVLKEYEGFDYTGTTISNKSGGTGWGGVWLDPDNDLNLSDDGVSLTSSALLFSPVGSRIFDTNGGEAQRELGATVDMGVDSVLYLGALLRKNTTSGGSSEYIECSLVYNASYKRLRFGIGSNDKFVVEVGNDGDVQSSISAVAGQTYYCVVKLVTRSSGNDEAFLKVYEPGDIMGQSEPTGSEWTISDTGDTASKLTRLYLQTGPNVTAGGSIDEFRIGKTWASVAPPPPCGTLVVIH